MYRLFLNIIIISIVLFTVSISVLRPKMHKNVFIYDSSYEIAQTSQDTQEKKNMPTQTVSVPQTKTIQKQEVVTYTPKQNTQKQTQKVEKTTKNTVKNNKKTVTKTPQTQKVQQVEKQTQKTEKTEKVVKVASQKQPETTKQTLTETQQQKQEEILWNKWRSDLQNQIMKDTKMPYVPQGTIFRFNFNVDKYGKITNLHVWSQNPSFTPYAIQYIAPVIRSYQGRSILNFPQGSNRVATTVDGGWKISNTARYSTSADFNDAERIIK